MKVSQVPKFQQKELWRGRRLSFGSRVLKYTKMDATSTSSRSVLKEKPKTQQAFCSWKSKSLPAHHLSQSWLKRGKNLQYSAPIPEGYSLNFTNLHAPTSTSSYMGYTNLNSHGTNQCAHFCNQQTRCVAFNLYFERDPTLDPSAQSCPNQSSLTNIKCVFWGVPVFCRNSHQL
jgi:hypothetical protein